MFLFLFTKSFIPVFRVWWSAGGFELDWQSCKCSNYFTLKVACGEWACIFFKVYSFWKKHSGMFYKQQRLFEFKHISKLFMFSLGWPRGTRVRTCTWKTRRAVCCPVCWFFSTNQLWVFLGLFLCLCALDCVFDSTVGKFYVRMWPQVQLVCCGCLFWSKCCFKMSGMAFKTTVTVGFQWNSL